eukprot:13826679-Alexandrium_andersonii.AAC.1
MSKLPENRVAQFRSLSNSLGHVRAVSGFARNSPKGSTVPESARHCPKLRHAASSSFQTA